MKPKVSMKTNWLLAAALLTIALIGVALYSVVLLVERRYAIPAA